MAVTVPYDTISTTSDKKSSSTCCCCIPLQTGCFILGYLGLVYNVFHIFGLLSVFIFVGIFTHGFDHLDKVEDENSPSITQVALLLGFVILIKLAWMIINIICLVGLHKKRPGPVKAYVGFALSRLLLSFAWFMCLMMTSTPSFEGNPFQTIVIHCTDLGLSAYFIMVYYKYALQLERERAEMILSPGSEYINNISYIILPKNDKERLVY